MSGRRRDGITPNLFPFLAVLVCTLGTLILLLALVAQNAGEAMASSTAAPEPVVDTEQVEMAKAAAALDQRIRETKWQRDQVVKTRDDQTADLETRRNRQAQIEDHVRRLRDELKRLETEVISAIENTQPDSDAAAVVKKLKAEIETEEAKISKLQSEKSASVPRIVIVPHKGPNGTDRRPIYVECRASGVYLQPEGIKIETEYLDEPSSLANPLDAALRATRHHAMQNYGDSEAPYPLLVVRPDGIMTYYIARKAMREWDDQYGYELVPDDVKLAFPPVDPALKKTVDLAVNEAIARQNAIARSALSPYGSGSGSGSGVGQTVPPTNNQAGTATTPNSSTQPGGSGPAGSSVTSSASRNRQPKLASEFRELSASNMDPQAGSSAGQLDYRRNRSGGSAAMSAMAEERQAQIELAQREAKLLAEGQRTAGSAGGDQLDMGEGEDALDGQNADAFAPLSDISTSAKSKRQSATTDPNAPIGGDQSSGSADQSNPAGTSPPPHPADGNSREQNASKSPAVEIKAGEDGQRKLIKPDRDNWALPERVANIQGTKMVRMIRVECFADRLVLVPEGGRGSTNFYDFSDGDLRRAALELATDIHDRVDRWGAGMPGGRWHPVVNVVVAPGGEIRFQQLSRLMEGSGIEFQSAATPAAGTSSGVAR